MPSTGSRSAPARRTRERAASAPQTATEAASQTHEIAGDQHQRMDDRLALDAGPCRRSRNRCGSSAPPKAASSRSPSGTTSATSAAKRDRCMPPSGAGVRQSAKNRSRKSGSGTVRQHAQQCVAGRVAARRRLSAPRIAIAPAAARTAAMPAPSDGVDDRARVAARRCPSRGRRGRDG